MKHTPKEWAIRDTQTEAKLIKHGENTVAYVFGPNYEAHARLIAAVPELLTACEGVLTALEQSNDRGILQAALRAAIAKATD